MDFITGWMSQMLDVSDDALGWLLVVFVWVLVFCAGAVASRGGRCKRASVESASSSSHSAEELETLSREDLLTEARRLHALLNSPHTAKFLEGTRREVAHQIERWGTVHDRAKEPQDWFWLLGYLAGKALAAHNAGSTEKALHHTISSAAVLANWHAAITCADSRMQPGSSDLQAFLETTFGTAVENFDAQAQRG